MISLDSFKTGFVLLSGLFFYDIYFVFGSKIMVTVAKSIDAPIMITFPRDIFTAPSGPSTMLGLGDIVLPGIYIALNLRYDLFEYHRQHPKRLYERTYRRFSKDFFHAALLAYCIGLIITVVGRTRDSLLTLDYSTCLQGCSTCAPVLGASMYIVNCNHSCSQIEDCGDMGVLRRRAGEDGVDSV